MNNSIFLITNQGTFSIRHTRIGLVILGVLFITLYILAIQGAKNFVHYNPYVLFLGISFLITGTVGLSKKSKFSPKVSVNDTYLLIKEGLWSGSHKYNWNDIEEITLGSYRITVNAKNRSKKFNIDSTSQISIEIKKSIREIGLQKNITVIGG